MKIKKFAIIVVLTLSFFTGGCAYYGNEAQHNKGDWYGITGSREVARIKSDKLAFKKLEATPVKTSVKDGAQQGYEGLIANLSNYNRYNFTLMGPENKSYLLGPGERAIDYLVPGNYVCIVYQGSSVIGSWAFRVSAQQSIFMNEKHHWYVYTER